MTRDKSLSGLLSVGAVGAGNSFKITIVSSTRECCAVVANIFGNGSRDDGFTLAGVVIEDFSLHGIAREDAEIQHRRTTRNGNTSVDRSR